MDTYKEKYEAALGMAKTLHKMAADTGYDNTRMALEHIFPQLRESEDERIYNEIMEFFKMNEKRCIVDNSYTKWIAYLEKQKEQKVDIDKLRKDIYQSGYNDGYQHGREDEQKEQKPIEPKFKVGDKIHLINGTSPNYEDDCITISEIGTENYFSEFKEGYVPIKQQDKWEIVKPKPVEWSEEQQQHFDEILICLLSDGHEREANILKTLFKQAKGLSKEDVDNAVKSFNSQRKQEWSEEDEKDNIYILLSMVDAINSVSYSGGTLRISDEKKKELKKFIINLSWKPSEEQMEAFKELIDNANKRGWVTPGASRLYEQLKAL